MEIAEKENVLLTICLIDERERESLAWLPSVGGGGEGVCRVEEAKRWLTFQTKNSPSPTKIGILRLPQPCNRNETLGLPRLQVHAPFWDAGFTLSKWGRDSRSKVCKRCEMPKITNVIIYWIGQKFGLG